MARAGVRFETRNGNLKNDALPLSDRVCGLLFDISAQTNFWTQGAGQTLAPKLKNSILEIDSLEEFEEFGVDKGAESQTKKLLGGITYYHVKHFFEIAGEGARLYIAFEDCSSKWDHILQMQKAASGRISQFGVWTEQHLWKKPDNSEPYALQIVGNLQSVANKMANELYAPAVILVNANTAKLATNSTPVVEVDFSKIPTCVSANRYVAVLLGQSSDVEVSKMQVALDSKTPVGCVGAALGGLSRIKVSECLGWVGELNFGPQFLDIEFGFGNATPESSKIKNPTPYDALHTNDTNDLDDKGYIFLRKYVGLSGVFFSSDATCSGDDFRTISLNRAINKSRRIVRAKLLPFVNSPVQVDPATGNMTPTQIQLFVNSVTDGLKAMVSHEEVSGIGEVTVPANQNVLKDNTVKLKYSIVPKGTAKTIIVEEALEAKRQGGGR